MCFAFVTVNMRQVTIVWFIYFYLSEDLESAPVSVCKNVACNIQSIAPVRAGPSIRKSEVIVLGARLLRNSDVLERRVVCPLISLLCSRCSRGLCPMTSVEIKIQLPGWLAFACGMRWAAILSFASGALFPVLLLSNVMLYLIMLSIVFEIFVDDHMWDMWIYLNNSWV